MKSSNRISAESNKGFSIIENLLFRTLFYILVAVTVIIVLCAMVVMGAYIASKMLDRKKEFKLAVRMSSLISVCVLGTFFAVYYLLLLPFGALGILLIVLSTFLFCLSMLTKILFVAYVFVKTTETKKHYHERDIEIEKAKKNITTTTKEKTEFNFSLCTNSFNPLGLPFM